MPYEVKKLVNSINSILDSKYGKLVKPEISNNQSKLTQKEKEEVEQLLQLKYEQSFYTSKRS